MTTIRNKYEKNLSLNKNDRRTTLTILATLSIVTIMIVGSLFTGAFLTDSTDPIKNIFLKATRYTLEYHDNVPNEEIVVPEQQVSYNEGKFTISSDKPLRDGFVFTSWNTKADGNGETVNPNTTYTTTNRHTDLYAQWEVGYTLIYDANGGKNAPEAQTQVTDADSFEFTIKGIESMSHDDEHKVFLGWADSADAKKPTYGKDGKYAYSGTDYGDGDNTASINGTKTLTADKKTVTVYAVWATKYELIFNYHPEMIDPECYGVGPKNGLPADLTYVTVEPSHVFHIPVRVEDGEGKNAVYRKEGYKWGWWGDNLKRFYYIEEDPTSPSNEGCYLYNEDVKALLEDNPVMNLYAYFQPPSTVSVAFEHNTQNLPDSVDRHDKKTNNIVKNMPDDREGWTTERTWLPWEDGVPTNIPTHPRYVFEGWAYKADSTEPDVMPGEKEFRVNTVISNKHKLYAIWSSGHNFRLYFSTNGGDTNYYRDTDGKWKSLSGWSLYYNSDDYTKEGANVFRKNPTEYFAGPVTWTKEFFATRGVFAVRKDDANGTYKFLGWSKTKNPTIDDLDYPVVNPNPKDPDNPDPTKPDLDNITGTVGCITDDVVFDHSDINVTSDNRPATHEAILYAVWQKSPKHQFRIVFNENGAKFNSGSIKTFASPSTSGYYSSIEHPYHEWTIQDLDKAPIASKEPTRTISYEFVGWNTKVDGTGITYTIDRNTKKINQNIRINEPAATPEECVGGYSDDHTLNLYPMFDTTPLHGYDVFFDVNAPSDAESVETYLYQTENNSLVKKKVVKSRPSSGQTLATGTLDSQTVDLDKKEYRYELDGKWFFATCENNSLTSSSNYKFLGWSYEKYDLNEYDPNNEEHHLDFPVTAPLNPDNPQDAGKLNKDVIIDVDKSDPESSEACEQDADEGKVHERTLYGVWQGEALHQYAVVFVGNGDGSSIVYAPKEKWETNNEEIASDTIDAGTEDFSGTDLATNPEKPGALDRNLTNTFRVYSDAKPMPPTSEPDSSESFTFDNTFWRTGFRNEKFKDSNGDYIKDVIVKAVRADSPSKRYTFKGWSTDSHASSANITIDPDGYINTDLTVNDSGYPCKSKTHHTVLYALWDDEDIHNFQLIFYANGGNQIGYVNDSGNWNYNSASYVPGYSYSIKKNTITDIDTSSLPDTLYYIGKTTTEKELTSVTSHTWSPSDQNPLRVEAKKANTTENGYTYRYEFMGWSDTPVEISESVTSDDANYHVDDKSYIQENITLTAPDGDCAHPTHTKILYAVWKKVLVTPEHSFTLRFNSNGGTSRVRLYNSSTQTWSNGSSYRDIRYPASGKVEVGSDLSHTFTKDEIASIGLGATRDQDTYYTYEFVGWSTSSSYNPDNPDTTNLISWEKDSNSEVTGDGFVNQDIVANCPSDPCKGGDHVLNIYAVWKRTPRTKTYTLKFDGNSENATSIPDPITEYETYTGNNSWNTHIFDISNTIIPTNKQFTFAGWHTDNTAKSGKYSSVYTGTNYEQKEILENKDKEYVATLANGTHEGEETLYAIWWYRFEVIYHANGGSQAPPLVHAYDSSSRKVIVIDANMPNRSGYTFLGWSTSPDEGAQVEYTPNQQITLVADEQGYTLLELYAVWQED